MAAESAQQGPGWPLRLLAFLPPVIMIGIPIILFAAQSFNSVVDGNIVREFSLDNYLRFVTDTTALSVFRSTLVICLTVAVVTTAVGYPIALWLTSLPARLRYPGALVFVVPLMLSYIIKIYAIRSILGSNGFLNKTLLGVGVIDQPLTFVLFNTTAITITLAVLQLPYVILPIFISLDEIPRNLIDASADLGASLWQTFKNVVWPLSRNGAMVGATFAFILAIGDFITPQMVGGMSGFTFGRLVYTQFGVAFNWPYGAALAVVLLITVGIALLVSGILSRAGRGQA